jgi:hypothetical protein
LLFSIGQAVENLQKKVPATTKEKVIITMLVDDGREIQAIAVTSLKNNELYVNVLLSAPWNVKLFSQVPAPHDTMAVQKAGMTTIRALYQLANLEKAQVLRLKPLQNSYTFYKDACDMLETEEGEFYYNITPDAVPNKLKYIAIPNTMQELFDEPNPVRIASKS